jgi:hypothetical protein
MGAYGRFGLMGPAMSYRECLRIALWHSRECGKAIQRACASLGVDLDDEPLQESGLAPLPPDGDVSGPDYIEPTAPLNPDLDNPQSRGGVYLLFDQLRRQ